MTEMKMTMIKKKHEEIEDETQKRQNDNVKQIYIYSSNEKRTTERNNSIEEEWTNKRKYNRRSRNNVRANRI